MADIIAEQQQGVDHYADMILLYIERMIENDTRQMDNGRPERSTFRKFYERIRTKGFFNRITYL
jgi:hypothetical protein